MKETAIIKDFLSGFKQYLENGLSCIDDLIVKRGNKEVAIKIPILSHENFGRNMAIDEKQIGEKRHAILSNRDTGKIALIAETVNFEELKWIFSEDELICREVDTVTRNLSHTYNKLCDTWFFNASHIADKVHIIKNIWIYAKCSGSF